MRATLLALALALPLGAAAGPNPQLLASIEMRLASYGIKVDTSALSTRQAAALHLTLVSGEDGYFEKRRKLISILHWEKEDRR